MAISARDDALRERLVKLIGRDCDHLGERCTLLDLVWPEGVMVLRTRSTTSVIHPDQYGQASCRLPELREVPVFAEDPSTYSQEFIELLASLGDRPQEH